MKKLINSLLLILFLSGIVACRSDFDPQEDGNHRFQKEKVKPMMKTVRMSFGGDFITESEEPLLRAEDGETYTAINVFRTEDKGDGTTEAEQRYAYGLFKGTDNISIDVETGYLYRFEASILIEREDKVLLNGQSYAEPFKWTTNNESQSFEYSKQFLQDFQYTTYSVDEEGIPYTVADGDRKYFCQLTNGTAYVTIGKDTDLGFGEVRYPRVKRFYGFTSGFNPMVSDEVEIDMDYKCFGLSILVESLPSGTLTVTDISTNPSSNDPRDHLIFPKNLALTNTAPNNQWSGVFSMNNLNPEYNDTFRLKFTWNKGGGNTDTFNADVTVKPKVNKILKINVTGSTNYNTTGNIILNIGSSELTNEDINIDRDADQNKTVVKDNSEENDTPQQETGE